MSCFTAPSGSAVLPICPKPLRLVRCLEPRTPGTWPDACWAPPCCLPVQGRVELTRGKQQVPWDWRLLTLCCPYRLLSWSAESTEEVSRPTPPPAPAPHQRCISGDLVAFSTCSQSSSGLCLTRMGHVSVRSTAAVWCLPWCSKGHAPDTLLTPPGLPAAPPRRKHPTASTRASRDGQIPHAEGTGDGGQRAHSSAPTHPTKEEATHSHLLRISSQRQSPAAPLLANPQRRDAKPTPGWAP